MKHYFGKAVHGEMILNDIGKIAEQHWMEIPNRFDFASLGNFVIMPNHMHGNIIRAPLLTTFLADQKMKNFLKRI